MVDVYTRIEQQPQEVLEAIARSMEVRASEPEMQDICASYLGRITRPRSPRVLEVGCGHGATTKLILRYLDPATLIGIDPAAGLIDMARVAFVGMPHVSFAVGDAAATGQPDQSFDLVIAHTVYSHLPDPGAALAESHRVLKLEGRLAIFDGDYATITLALFDGDPLRAAVDVVLRHMVHAPYVMRRLPALAASAGFAAEAAVPHGYVQTRPLNTC